MLEVTEKYILPGIPAQKLFYFFTGEQNNLKLKNGYFKDPSVPSFLRKNTVKVQLVYLGVTHSQFSQFKRQSCD